MSAPVASGWSGRRVGLAPTGKAPPCHGARGQRTLVLCAQQDCEGILIWLLIWQMGRIFGDTGSLGETGCKQKRSGDVE